ncbi:MAG: hypothetical protein AB8F95_03325 [Bacteroidia bacterium]
MRQCTYNHILITTWLILLIVIPASLQAGDVKLIRTIEKAFPTWSNQKVNIQNQYGTVYITSGSSSRITLKVTIIAKGNTEYVAQKLINEVDIKTTSLSNELRVGTETPRSPGMKLGDKGLSVRYELEIPRANPLKVYNKFGDISLGDRKGDVEVIIKNGTLTAGKLEGSVNDLRGHFSHADIGYLRTGQIDFKFGNVTVSQVGYLRIKQAGGDLNIGVAKSLEMYVKQGKVSIGRADVVRGEYSSKFFALGYLGKLLDMEVKYAETFTVGEVGADFTSINIEQSYTPVQLNFNPEARFKLQASMKKASLTYDAPTVSMTIMESKSTDECKCTQMDYYGQFGGGSNRPAKVKIEGYFGSVKITQ